MKPVYSHQGNVLFCNGVRVGEVVLLDSGYAYREEGGDLQGNDGLSRADALAELEMCLEERRIEKAPVEELEAELRAEGVDVEGLVSRMMDVVTQAKLERVDPKATALASVAKRVAQAYDPDAFVHPRWLKAWRQTISASPRDAVDLFRSMGILWHQWPEEDWGARWRRVPVREREKYLRAYRMYREIEHELPWSESAAGGGTLS